MDTPLTWGQVAIRASLWPAALADPLLLVVQLLLPTCWSSCGLFSRLKASSVLTLMSMPGQGAAPCTDADPMPPLLLLLLAASAAPFWCDVKDVLRTWRCALSSSCRVAVRNPAVVHKTLGDLAARRQQARPAVIECTQMLWSVQLIHAGGKCCQGLLVSAIPQGTGGQGSWVLMHKTLTSDADRVFRELVVVELAVAQLRPEGCIHAALHSHKRHGHCT